MFQSYQQFIKSGGSAKTTRIQPQQLLAAIISHMQRLDKQFTLYVNGRLPKPIYELLHDAFSQCHLQQPFYTQHCDKRNYRYMKVSKNRVKIDFTFHYRMSREQEKWMLEEMQEILVNITHPQMTNLEKIIAVHDYIVQTYY